MASTKTKASARKPTARPAPAKKPAKPAAQAKPRPAAKTKPRPAPKPAARPKPAPKAKLEPKAKPAKPAKPGAVAQPTPPPPKFDHDLAYTCVSGETLARSVYVGVRQVRGGDGSEIESWVGHFQNGRVKCFYEHLAGVWVSRTGRIYLATVTGTLIQYEDTLFDGPGVRNRIPGMVEGIWGFDDDTTYVWTKVSETERLLFDASGSPLPHPNDGRDADARTLYIVGMHGHSHDAIYAACWNGLARWDGWEWQHTDLPAAAVFGASEDEVYVCTRTGELHRGSGDRFELVATWPGTLMSVAKFGGHVFVLSEKEGLLRYDPDARALVSFKPSVLAHSLEARDELLIAAKNRLVWTRDGERFFGRRGMLEEMTAEEPFLGLGLPGDP